MSLHQTGRIVLVVALFSFTTVGETQAQTYDPGPAPSITGIGHECVAEYPEPRDRTVIGIGEEVTLWVEGWSDPDIEYDQYGGQTTVYDYMGEVTWMVLSGEGQVYPTYGSMTTLTADLAANDNTIVVEVAVKDAAAFSDDAEDAKKQKAVDAKIPKGFKPIAYSDTPPPLQEGTDHIGCVTRFLMQATPVGVSFKGLKIRENYEEYTWEWPNGTPDKIPAGKPEDALTDVPVGTTIFPNVAADIVGTVGTGPGGSGLSVNLLKDKNTGQFVDFDKPNPTVPVEFQDKNENWKVFQADGTRPRKWEGATKKGKAGVIADDFLWGGWQGPFKKP